MASAEIALVCGLKVRVGCQAEVEYWRTSLARGRPRGHILKSLALASKPQVLENWPVLDSRTALLFESLKFCGAPEKFFGRRSFLEIARKILVKTFFFEIACKKILKIFSLESTCACVFGRWPWPREGLSSEGLSLASRRSVLGKAVFGLGLGFFWCPWPRALYPRLHLWCQDRLCVNSDADETQDYWESRYVR